MIKNLIKGYEDRFGNAYITTLFVLVSIVPATILFFIFDTVGEITIGSTAGFIESAKFGGAFAGFLATLLILINTHKSIIKDESLIIKGTVYRENSAQSGVVISVLGDSRVTKTTDTGYFSIEVDPQLTEWVVTASLDNFFSEEKVQKKNIKSPVRINLKKN